MKKLTFSLFFLGLVFAGSFALARWVPLFENQVVAADLPGNFVQPPFQATPYPIENRPFAVIIVGVNNGAHVEKTLQSVFSQNYQNFRLIYIDDASDDGSFELARDRIYESRHQLPVTLVKNEERLGPLANLVRAIQACADEEVVVVLEGEDWLAHEWVLQRVNSYYNDPDLWLTYGQYLCFPHFEPGSCRLFTQEEWKEKGVRGSPFLASHLKTFYAALFKKIQEADFIYQGKFFPAAAELAYMLPMLEMAKDHFQFIPEVLYIRCREQQEVEISMRCERFIRSLNPYEPLASLSFGVEPSREEL